MKRKFTFCAVGILGLMFGVSPSVMARSLAPGIYTMDEDDPVYPVNQVTDFMITRINPSEDYLVAEYTNRSGFGIEKLQYVNIAYGDADMTDLELFSMHSADRFKMIRIYNASTAFDNPKFYEGSAEMLASETLNYYGSKASKITELPDATLMYSALLKYPDFWVTGKIDYGRCVNAPEYREGMECRAEIMGDTVLYQPYNEGVRVEITESEKDNTDKVDEGDSTEEASDVNSNIEDRKEDETALPIVKPILPVAPEVERELPSNTNAKALALAEAVEDIFDNISNNVEVADFVQTNGDNALAVSGNVSANDGGLYDSKTNKSNDSVARDDGEVNVPILGFARWCPWCILGITSLVVSGGFWWFLFIKRKKERKEQKKV